MVRSVCAERFGCLLGRVPAEILETATAHTGLSSTWRIRIRI
jgi:hypothetical protein